MTSFGVQSAITLEENIMKIMPSLKNVWLAVGVVSMILLAFRWFGFDSEGLRNSLLVLNMIAFALSLPSSLFVAIFAIASNYYMSMSPTSSSAIYLYTIFLFVIGLTQWFWVARFWSGASHQLQGLELYDVK